MNLMYNALTNQNVHHHVKPQIVAAMGDAALALGPDFKRVSFPKIERFEKKNFSVTVINRHFRK